MENKYISLQEATKYCFHSQEYLSLRARQGKLKAVKFGRNWVTKKEWIEDYLRRTNKYKKSNNDLKEEKVSEPPENLPIGTSSQSFYLSQQKPKVQLKDFLRIFRSKFDFTDTTKESKLISTPLVILVFVLSIAGAVFVILEARNQPEIFVFDWPVFFQYSQENLYPAIGRIGKTVNLTAKEILGDITRAEFEIKSFVIDLSLYVHTIGKDGGIMVNKVIVIAKETIFSRVGNLAYVTENVSKIVPSFDFLKPIIDIFVEYGKWLSSVLKEKTSLFF